MVSTLYPASRYNVLHVHVHNVLYMYNHVHVHVHVYTVPVLNTRHLSVLLFCVCLFELYGCSVLGPDFLSFTTTLAMGVVCYTHVLIIMYNVPGHRS